MGAQNPPSISLQILNILLFRTRRILGSASHSNICSLKPLQSRNLDLEDLWGLLELFWGSSVSGGKLWKVKRCSQQQTWIQLGQIALMDSVKMFTMKTVIKPSEHLSFNTHVTNLLISHSRNDFIYLLCFGLVLIFIQTRPFVILTTFIKVSFIRPQWHQSKLQMTTAVRSWHCYHFKGAKWERL